MSETEEHHDGNDMLQAAAGRPMTEILRKTIDAGGRFSTRLETGDLLRIVDLHGKQAVDFLAYAAELRADRYNAANTMKINGSIYLGKGTRLYSDRA